MKRPIAAFTVIILIAVVLLGNRITARVLDAQLGPLLTRQLGLPVQLAPITARVIPLHAYSDKLVMGPADKPAVVATDVEVGLSWPDLLRGEVRIVFASANDLMVQPSRWPASDSPASTDYTFLDQWLPRNLLLESGRYVDAEGGSYPVQKAHWQRTADGGASVNWLETREAGEIALSANLHSLQNLLTLAPLALDFTMEVTGATNSKIALNTTIAPDKNAAYIITGDLSAADLSAHVTATGKTTWSFPDKSDIHIPKLEPKELQALIKQYSAADSQNDKTDTLSATLPRLDLPGNEGHVVIDELRWGDEVARSTTFDFTSSEQGLQVTALSSKGPSGNLTGTLGVHSTDAGWQLKINASVAGNDNKDSLAAEFVGADWLWHTGQTTLSGSGTTLNALLNSMRGDLTLAGEYAGKVPTPIAINARLDNRPGEFALDEMTIKAGAGVINGSAVLSGSEQRKLTLTLKSDKVNLGFLVAEDSPTADRGVGLPEYLALLPELDLDVALNVIDLEAPGLSLAKATAKLQRTRNGGTLHATASGKNYGTLELTMTANTPAENPDDVKLDIKFGELDLPDMFKQPDLIYSRTSGTMNFTSRGQGIAEIFSAMRGHAELKVEVRPDNNWKREAGAHETLAFTGDSRFVIEKDRIVGVQIQKIDIDSIAQDLTGEMSVVSGRTPWLVADLESEKLDLSGLLAMLPQASDTSTKKPEVLQSLKSLGATKISFNAKTLTLDNIPLQDVVLEIASSIDAFAIEQLNFSAQSGKLASHGNISWKKERAKFDGDVTLSNLSLDQLLIRSKAEEQVPVSGSAKLSSEGSDMEELLANLVGNIDLEGSAPAQQDSLKSRRKLQMTATRLPDGMQAKVSSLQWGESELAGQVRYRRGDPAQIEIDIEGGSVSLLPWENAYLASSDKPAKKPTGSAVSATAKASAKFVGDILLSPMRFFTGGDKAKSGGRIFSTDPLPMDSLKDLDLKLSGHLNSLTSTDLAAKDLQVAATVANGQLHVQASSGTLGGGNGNITLAVDTNATPPTLKLDSTFDQVRGLANETTYPRSGTISMQTRGDSEAALAANADGLIYLELGKGPFDYANSALLTANLASTVFTTLIPGIEKRKPEIDCGVTVALFTAGLGSTPYGFAARTDQANLLGHVEIDLVQETMQMSLDSRGRHGIGLSVGSVFSNTIQIKGPLNDPAIVPDTTSLIWRGWAAFMTGGLSILGETVVKRILASDNPCNSTKKIIREDLCPKNELAAASPMVCPQS